jgi:hypothetical protein
MMWEPVRSLEPAGDLRAQRARQGIADGIEAQVVESAKVMPSVEANAAGQSLPGDQVDACRKDVFAARAKARSRTTAGHIEPF